MLFHEQSEDYRPLFWMAGRPIYAFTLIFILHIVAFIATAIAMSFTPGVIHDLELYPPWVLHGQVWRLASYIIFPPSVWFIFYMGFFYFAAKEVEQFVGWKTFLKLYAALVLIPAIVLCLVDRITSMDAILGGLESFFGVFVALATIYPGMYLNMWFVNLSVKAWAWILLGVLSLINLSDHAWSSMLVLWTSAAVGYGTMRLIGAGKGFDWLTDWLDERRAQKLIRQRNFKLLEDKKDDESIDAILEKISKQGVASLDAREKAALERARANLLKRDQH